MQEQVTTRVNNIMAGLFEIDPKDLTPEKHVFNDLGLDSLDAIDLVVQFQREFKIRPANDELRAIRTLGDVHNLVAKYYDKKA
ncbi:MAG: acyl carrier protein [Oligoflexales bacterium]